MENFIFEIGVRNQNNFIKENLIISAVFQLHRLFEDGRLYLLVTSS